MTAGSLYIWKRCRNQQASAAWSSGDQRTGYILYICRLLQLELSQILCYSELKDQVAKDRNVQDAELRRAEGQTGRETARGRERLEAPAER